MKKDIKDLLIKYREGSITEQELALLETWYLQWLPEQGEISMEKLDELEQEVYGNLPKPEKTSKLWLRYGGVAATVAAIIFGGWFYNYRVASSQKAPRKVSTIINDIAPGKNTATLAVAGGKVINLDTNKPSVTVMDSVKTNTMLTASTPRGGTYQFILQDGTKVWLNADSKLEFLSDYRNKLQRIVKIIGEAYFEVAKNRRVPFIVESNRQRIEVLGTHFIVNAYKDEDKIKTTLVEGSIKVSSLPRNGISPQRGERILKPGQQSILIGNDIKLVEADMEEETAWINGYFNFNEEKLESIMRKLSRWYDVDVVYVGEKPTEEFTGKVSRYKNISYALKMLGYANLVKFKIEGRKIYVSKI